MSTGERVAASALDRAHSWVGNREVEGRAGRRAAVNPATGAPFAEATLLDAIQAADAVGAAAAAFGAWSRLSFRDRGRVLQRVHDLVLAEASAIAALIEREQGKPAAEAHLVEVFPALESLAHLVGHAEELLRDDAIESHTLLLAHKDCRLVYAPLGVVLAITPWNYPFAISLTGVAAALIAGSPVALKPPPATTLVGLRIGALFREAGAPEGVVSVVAVDDGVAAGLVEDPRVAKIVFTGSV